MFCIFLQTWIIPTQLAIEVAIRTGIKYFIRTGIKIILNTLQRQTYSEWQLLKLLLTTSFQNYKASIRLKHYGKTHRVLKHASHIKQNDLEHQFWGRQRLRWPGSGSEEWAHPARSFRALKRQAQHRAAAWRRWLSGWRLWKDPTWEGYRASSSHAAPAAVGQPGLCAPEAPVHGELRALALVTGTSEVPGPASLLRLHCNNKAKDQMDAGTRV